MEGLRVSFNHSKSPTRLWTDVVPTQQGGGGGPFHSIFFVVFTSPKIVHKSIPSHFTGVRIIISCRPCVRIYARVLSGADILHGVRICRHANQTAAYSRETRHVVKEKRKKRTKTESVDGKHRDRVTRNETKIKTLRSLDDNEENGGSSGALQRERQGSSSRNNEKKIEFPHERPAQRFVVSKIRFDYRSTYRAYYVINTRRRNAIHWKKRNLLKYVFLKSQDHYLNPP